jgi:TonB family protein
MSFLPPVIESAAGQPAPAERRRHPRTPVAGKRPITVTLGQKDSALLLDLGRGGIGIRAVDRVEAGSTAALHFELQDTYDPITATGTISWTDSSGRAGICFESLSADCQAQLDRWLAGKPAPREPKPAVAAADTRRMPEIAAIERELVARRLRDDAALCFIVERARALTHAGGAAIALSGTDGIVCRATTGNAPALGVHLQPDSGLSGECIRSGIVARCEDTELDPRVDREACRVLNLRSAVVVPLAMSEFTVVGLLEVFSPTQHAFNGRDVLLLRSMAELIVRTLTTPPEPEGILSEEESESASADEEPGPPALPADKIICDVCGHENLRADRDCKNCDVPLPHSTADTPTSSVTEVALEYLRETATAQHARSAAQHGSSLGRRIAIFTAAVLLVAAGAFAWRQWHARAQASSSALQQSEPLQVFASSQPDPADVAPVELQPVIAPASSGIRPAPPTPAARPAPIASSNNNAVVYAPDIRPLPAPTAPPQLTSGALTASPLVSAVLTAASPGPRLLPPTSRGVVPAALLRRVEPAYPQDAKSHGIQGSVVLRATITRKGTVEAVQVERGNPLLATAAMRAVREWRYKPQELDGQPVDTETIITINFAMRR